MSETNEVLNFTVDGPGSTLHIRLLHSIGEHSRLSFSSPSLYEARITCTFNGKTVSIFDIPFKLLLVLINEYHKQTKSKAFTELSPPFRLKKRNIITIIKASLHLYLREKAPSSFFSSIDVITIDEPSDRPVGRTKIELDADIINFIPVQYTDRNFGLLFLLHQTSVALVFQMFRSKSEDLRNWLDRKIRIVKLCSFFIGIIGPVILNGLPSNSSDIYEMFWPLFFTLSYFGFFTLWYTIAPRLILRLFIRIVVKKIME